VGVWGGGKPRVDSAPAKTQRPWGGGRRKGEDASGKNPKTNILENARERG